MTSRKKFRQLLLRPIRVLHYHMRQTGHVSPYILLIIILILILFIAGGWSVMVNLLNERENPSWDLMWKTCGCFSVHWKWNKTAKLQLDHRLQVFGCAIKRLWTLRKLTDFLFYDLLSNTLYNSFRFDRPGEKKSTGHIRAPGPWLGQTCCACAWKELNNSSVSVFRASPLTAKGQAGALSSVRDCNNR